MIERLTWAGLALAAAVAALGFAATAATLLLAQAFGVLIAAAIMSGVLAALAGLGFWLAMRHAGGAREPEEVVAALARDMIRKQPLSAVALCGALGYAVAKRPQVAAELGRGVAKLMMS